MRALTRRSVFGFVFILATAMTLVVASGDRGGTPPDQQQALRESDPAGVVCHVKVLSDKVEDVSSLQAWKQVFIRDGMSDQEKALAVWKSAVKFQFQDAPPFEHLQLEDLVLDPIKLANVYGYSYCSVAAANVQALARYAGLQARGWTIQGHVVPEIFWDGQWHMLDASLINYFPKADGKLASVEEIVAGVKDWYAQHPEFKGNERKLQTFMSNGGWKKGPEVLARSPFYDENGWLPAASHGWYSTMQEYSGATLFPYESGYSQGYEVNLQLRRGERLTRNWSNLGNHVEMNEKGQAPASLTEIVGQGMLRYSPRYGDLAPGRIGNGTLEYEVPLASGAFRSGTLTAENLACTAEDGTAPALHTKYPSRPGILVIRMPSSYVYLGGTLTMKTAVADGGRLSVLLSDNNGLDWKPVTTITASGDQRVDLKPFVFRRYDYRLKFVLEGKGTGLDALRIANVIQHSQRPLPALAEGHNNITFTSDQESTITSEGSTSPGSKGKQLLYTDFHPQSVGISSDRLMPTGGTGAVTFPIETPGELVRLRIGAFYRARDKADAWEVQGSFDGGKTFKPITRMEGPTVAAGRYVVVTEVPPGAKAALVRLVGTQRNTAMLYNVRIDADYREPQGGFVPVKITYRWEENGQPKEHVHVAEKPGEVYSIDCGSRPRMKSIALELAS